MIAQAAAGIRGPRALCLPVRPAFKLAPSLRWPAITLAVVGYRHALSSFKLAAGIFGVAAVTLAIMTYLEVKQDIAAIDSVRNGTRLNLHKEASYRHSAQDETSD